MGHPTMNSSPFSFCTLVTLRSFAIFAAAAIGTLPASAFSWEEAIEKVEASSAAYFDYAVDHGSGYPGTASASVDFDRHQCAILGRMLGLESVVTDLEVLDYPTMDPTTDVQELLLFSVSLENWGLAARRALEMDEAGRKNAWNLDCVGHLGISANHYLDNSESQAQFKVEGSRLLVYGDIDVGFYERFINALDETSGVTEIAFGSGGGSVRDALLSGYEIRARALDTSTYGNCFSACPLVFMGGVDRNIWMGPHLLGFHQISRGGVAVQPDDEIYRLTAVYLDVMGVDPAMVIAWMLSASPTEMHKPRLDELCAPRVATWIQRTC